MKAHLSHEGCSRSSRVNSSLDHSKLANLLDHEKQPEIGKQWVSGDDHGLGQLLQLCPNLKITGSSCSIFYPTSDRPPSALQSCERNLKQDVISGWFWHFHNCTWPTYLRGKWKRGGWPPWGSPCCSRRRSGRRDRPRSSCRRSTTLNWVVLLASFSWNLGAAWNNVRRICQTDWTVFVLTRIYIFVWLCKVLFYNKKCQN